MWGVKNWDYKARGEQGTLSVGLHRSTKAQKLHEYPKSQVS